MWQSFYIFRSTFLIRYSKKFKQIKISYYFFLEILFLLFFVGYLEETLRKEQNYFEVTHSNSKGSFKKKRTVKRRKTAPMCLIWFWVHWLVEHPPKSVKYRFAKFGPLTGNDSKEGGKIILRLLFLTRRQVLIKSQGAPSHREHWWKWLIFDSGCTGWQTTPQNLVNMYLPNLVGWLEETLVKE